MFNSTNILSSLKVIDADTHYTEPHDLWIKRAPRNMRDRVPQVKAWGDDIAWVIDGDKSIGDKALSLCSIKKNGSKGIGLEQLELRMEAAHPGAYDIKERLALMDRIGIWAQVVYPNLLGFGGQKSVIVDPELRLLCVQIYNDAMAEMQTESRERLIPMALLPWWDVGQAVKEAERTHAMGLRGINVNSDPHKSVGSDGVKLPNLADEYWEPLWEVCASLQLPVNFHIGGSETSIDWVGNAPWPGLDGGERATVGSLMLFLDNARVMANLIVSGMLDRYPALRFVSVESGVSWIPFVLDGLDYMYKQFPGGKPLQKAPSEYFSSNFHGCFWFERRNMAQTIRSLGVGNVLFETDFPHPTCLYPADTQSVVESLQGLADEEVRMVMSGNAAKLYRIPVV